MLSAYGEVLSKRYSDSRVTVHCRIPQRAVAHLYDGATTIRPHTSGGNGLLNGNGAAHADAPPNNGAVK